MVPTWLRRCTACGRGDTIADYLGVSLCRACLTRIAAIAETHRATLTPTEAART